MWSQLTYVLDSFFGVESLVLNVARFFK